MKNKQIKLRVQEPLVLSRVHCSLNFLFHFHHYLHHLTYILLAILSEKYSRIFVINTKIEK